jgi:hypothetical protein
MLMLLQDLNFLSTVFKTLLQWMIGKGSKK